MGRRPWELVPFDRSGFLPLGVCGAGSLYSVSGVVLVVGFGPHASWKATNLRESVWEELYPKIMKIALRERASVAVVREAADKK